MHAALGQLWASLVTVRLMLSRRDRQGVPSLPPLPMVTRHGNASVRQVSVLLAPHLPRGNAPYTIRADGVHGGPG
jgi:hypothetical protein